MILYLALVFLSLLLLLAVYRAEFETWVESEDRPWAVQAAAQQAYISDQRQAYDNERVARCDFGLCEDA